MQTLSGFHYFAVGIYRCKVMGHITILINRLPFIEEIYPPMASMKISRNYAVGFHQELKIQAASGKKNEILVVILENLYRNWQNSTFSDYGSVLEKTDNFNNRWSLVHLCLRSICACCRGGRSKDSLIITLTKSQLCL